MNIGVLALQGDFDKHTRIIHELGWNPLKIRYPSHLDCVEGLVIPGGESTTMSNLMERMAFHKPIQAFAKSFPVLGTCAGLILMADFVHDDRVRPLSLLNISVDRNAYGRQMYSFIDDVTVSTDEGENRIRATFIRAPKITKIGQSVSVLSYHDDNPVVVKQGKHIGLSFHPELDKVTLFHKIAFLNTTIKTEKINVA